MSVRPENQLTAAAERLFAGGGPLAAAFAESGRPFERRDEQVKVALDYARAIFAPDPDPERGGKVGAIEAAAGMGKTVAYLAALALNAAVTEPPQRALISTRTRALQRQIVDDGDGEIVRRAVCEMEKRDVSVARQIGRGNYLDRERAARTAEELRREKDPRADRLKAVAECGAKTLDELRDKFEIELPPGIVPADICVTPASSEAAAARYQADREQARNADIVVVNHALALADARLRGGVVSADRSVGLFDEADTLPDQARAMSDERADAELLRTLAESLPDEDAKTLRPTLNELADAARNALQNGARPVNPSGDIPDQVRDAADKIAAVARKLSAVHSDIRDELHRAAAVLRHWAKAARDGNPNFAATIVPAPTRRRPAFSLCALAPAFVVSRLWETPDRDGQIRPPLLRAVVLTSATLPESVLRAVGINAGPGQQRRSDIVFDTIPRHEPRRFGELKFILADPSAPKPYERDIRESGPDEEPPRLNPDFAEYAADAVLAADKNNGRVLVLATSFAFAETVGEKIRQRIPAALVHQKGEPLGPLLEQYRAEKNAVLITPSAWEGVNLPGLVDDLVIPALPYPPWPRDFLAALEEKFRATAKSPQLAAAVVRRENSDHAARKLRQGIGRGIRRESDQCRLWILDPRFPRPGAKNRGDNLAAAVPRRFNRAGGPFRPGRAKLFLRNGELRPVPKLR